MKSMLTANTFVTTMTLGGEVIRAAGLRVQRFTIFTFALALALAFAIAFAATLGFTFASTLSTSLLVRIVGRGGSRCGSFGRGSTSSLNERLGVHSLPLVPDDLVHHVG